MMAARRKPTHGLERAVAKYETKLAKATNPTQRQYASNMLRMARAALAEARQGDPAIESNDATVIDLHPDEYEEK